MNQQSSIAPFSVYQITPPTPKYCYQSQSLTIFLQISGPYFDRNRVNNDPTFNCNILGSKLSQPSTSSLSTALKQILAQLIVKQKYSRFNFDLIFQIVEDKADKASKGQNTIQDFFVAFVNLLAFAVLAAGVEVRGIFAAGRVSMLDDRVFWGCLEQQQGKEAVKSLCIVMESSQKNILYCKMEGQFVFVHYQRMCNLLMDYCEQIHTYIAKKAHELNNQYQS